MVVKSANNRLNWGGEILRERRIADIQRRKLQMIGAATKTIQEPKFCSDLGQTVTRQTDSHAN